MKDRILTMLMLSLTLISFEASAGKSDVEEFLLKSNVTENDHYTTLGISPPLTIFRFNIKENAFQSGLPENDFNLNSMYVYNVASPNCMFRVKVVEYTSRKQMSNPFIVDRIEIRDNQMSCDPISAKYILKDRFEFAQNTLTYENEFKILQGLKVELSNAKMKIFNSIPQSSSNISQMTIDLLSKSDSSYVSFKNNLIARQKNAGFWKLLYNQNLEIFKKINKPQALKDLSLKITAQRSEMETVTLNIQQEALIAIEELSSVNKKTQAAKKAADEKEKLETAKKAADEKAKVETAKKAADAKAKVETSKKAADEKAKIETAKKAADEKAKIETDKKHDNDDEKAKLEAAKKADIKGDYLGFMNGRNFISTKNISKDAAYANCKLNAANNPKLAVYCTFNGLVIFGVKM